MTTSRSPKQAPRPSLPMIAATTAALPAVVLSSLALAQPAAAEAPARAIPATLAAAMKAQAAEAKAALIPAASVSASIPTAFRPAQPAAPAEYTIARGDTISAIAGKFGLNTGEVLALNNLQPNTIIYPGQKIRLSGSAASPAPAPAPAAAPAAPATSGANYTVKAGDTLSAIAARHNIGLSEIFSWNGLNMRSTIYPGQKVKVGSGEAAAAPAPQPAAAPAAPAAAPAPAAPNSSGGSYTVKAGDTLSAIAARHNVGLSEVFSWNGLNMGSIIYPGQKIKVGPGSAAPAPQHRRRGPCRRAAPHFARPGSYTIKSGDTLSAHRVAARRQALRRPFGQPADDEHASSTPARSWPSRCGDFRRTGVRSRGHAPGSSTFLGFTYPGRGQLRQREQGPAQRLTGSHPRPDEAIVAERPVRMGVDPSLAGIRLPGIRFRPARRLAGQRHRHDAGHPVLGRMGLRTGGAQAQPAGPLRQRDCRRRHHPAADPHQQGPGHGYRRLLPGPVLGQQVRHVRGHQGYVASIKANRTEPGTAPSSSDATAACPG